MTEILARKPPDKQFDFPRQRFQVADITLAGRVRHLGGKNGTRRLPDFAEQNCLMSRGCQAMLQPTYTREQTCNLHAHPRFSTLCFMVMPNQQPGKF